MANVPIRIKRGNTAFWASAPTLLLGQPGVDTTTHELAIGDGSTAWASLPKYSTGAGATIADQTILGNNSGGTAAPTGLTASQVRTLLSLVPGTNVQAYDAELAAIAGLTSAANKGIMFTGAGTAGTYDLSAFALTMLDDANAAAVLATIGAYASTTPLNSITAPSGNVDMNGHSLINLADPASAQDAATKAYVDALSAGLKPKDSVRAISTSNITLSGAQTIDGVSVIAGDRVLVAGQSTGANNGIYVCASGAWSRSTDANTSAKVKAGMYCFVEEGTTYADTGWVLSTNNTITLGSTSLAFTQFSSAGSIVDGSALTLTGNVLDVNVDGTTIEISSDALRIKDLGVGTAKLAASAVTLAKMADMATASLLGRNTGGTGAPEVLSAATVRALLDLEAGTDFNTYSAKLAAIDALTWAADKGVYLTGTNTLAAFDLSSFARTLLDDANASAFLGTLGFTADAKSLIALTDYAAMRLALGAMRDTTTLDLIPSAVVAVDLNGQNISNLADPSAAKDATTKQYVDSLASGLKPKDSVRAISTSNITLSGAQTIDGVSVIAGDRVLVAGQSTGADNGIYVCASGAWSRATDADTSAEVKAGMYCFVEEGTTYADTGWVLSTNNTITLGSTSLAFTQFSGAGSIVDGSALTKTGNTLDVNVDGSTIEVSSDALRIKDLGVGTAKLAASAVTLAKMADMATASLLGRNTAGTGAPEVLSASTARSLLGLVIGTNVQAWDTDLDAIAALTRAQGDLLYGGSSAWSNLAAGTNGKRLRTNGSGANPSWEYAESCYVFHHSATNAITWTDMPAALTALNGQITRCVHKLNLANYTQCRLVVMTATTGASGAKLIAKYNTSYDSTIGNYSDIGTSEVSATVDASLTMTSSSWIDLASGAKADVVVAIAGSGGNGAADPVITSISLQFR